MQLLRVLAWVVLACSVSFGPGAVAATLNDGTYQADYLYPDDHTDYPHATATGPFTPQDGTDAVIEVEGVTLISFDLDGSTLTVDFATTLAYPTWTWTAFNGVRLTALGGLPNFSGITYLGGLSTFGPTQVSFTPTELFLNWAGVPYRDGQRAVFSVAFDDQLAVMPLPGALPLMMAALAGLGLFARRRKLAADRPVGCVS